jgi:hypothetical protein
MGLLTLKAGETVNAGAERLADEHAFDVLNRGNDHSAIAFCECETARAYRACKADPRYLHKAVTFPPEVGRLSSNESNLKAQRGAYEPGVVPAGDKSRVFVVAVEVTEQGVGSTVQDVAAAVERALYKAEGVKLHNVAVWPDADSFAEDYAEARLEPWVEEEGGRG